MTPSRIEWTDEVWNPVTGCTKVSPGCDHCYAERITERFSGSGSFATVQLHEARLENPLRWRRPRRVFVNSMSDLFHVAVPTAYIERVFDVMRRSPAHTFQVLTKRAERMERLCTDRQATPAEVDDGYELGYVPGLTYDLPNVWLGVSVESPAFYSRIRHLQRTHAAVRFLSCEPLLGALPGLPLEGIGWVIVGGESGPGARPMHPEWVRGIREQCLAAGVPFFFKQWGEWLPRYTYSGHAHAIYTDRPEERPALYLNADGRHGVIPDLDAWLMQRVGKHRAGRTLDGRTWDEYPPERR